MPACLASLAKTRYQPTEICVVDNLSKDGSLDYLKTNHPSVRLFALSENLGYSGAYNRVMPAVSGEFVVLLNFDTEVEPNWLDQAIELFQSNSRIAAVQPKLRALQRKEFFEYAGASGGFIDRYGYPFARGRIMAELEQDSGQYDDARPVHWASGAALIVRRSTYLECGGLDDDFFLHMEELDLCWRYWLFGYECWVAPLGVVYHFSGAALSAERLAKMYYNHRNSLVMMIKNYGARRLLCYFPVRMLLDFLTMLAAPLRKEPKRSWAIVMAYGYLLRNIFHIFSKRKHVQSRRTVADSKLDAVIFPGSLLWQVYLKKHSTFRQIISAW